MKRRDASEREWKILFFLCWLLALVLIIVCVASEKPGLKFLFISIFLPLSFPFVYKIIKHNMNNNLQLDKGVSFHLTATGFMSDALTALAFQISSAYCLMVRSDENFPDDATFIKAIVYHFLGFCEERIEC